MTVVTVVLVSPLVVVTVLTDSGDEEQLVESTGFGVGAREGELVGFGVTLALVGAMVGVKVGTDVGEVVGEEEGTVVGEEEGTGVGAAVGKDVGVSVATDPPFTAVLWAE